MNNSMKRGGVLVFGMFAAMQVQAQTPPPARGQPEEKGWSFTLGGAALVMPEFEGSRNYKLRPLPLLEARYSNWASVSTRGGARIDVLAATGRNETSYGRVSLGPLLRYRAGRSTSDNDALRGFKSLDDAVEGGAFAGFAVGPWVAEIAYGQALNDDTHEGSLIDASIGYRMPLTERLAARVGAKIGWASENYMKNTFGLDAATARSSGLSTYSVSSGIKDTGLTAGGQYTLGSGWSLDMSLGYTRLLGDAADSPLVAERGSRNQFMVGGGLAFRF
ncbi:MAG: MipA/OmpV family protein [Azospirillum sp.]|nr:MipA/OmpV family protein [Azospirillum sp.]